MHARFVRTKHGYRCTNLWKSIKDDFQCFDVIGVIFINVTKAPPVGKFCKRPHHYL